MQTNSLADRIVIVTGASSGIGRACAEVVAASGALLVMVDLNAPGLEQTENELVEGGAERERLLSIAASIRDETAMAEMATKTVERFGRIDALVACAGLLRLGEKLTTVGDTTLEEWETIVGTNLTGTFLSNRAVLPQMMEQREGDIINVSSTSGLKGRPFDGPYCASKFGIVGLSESLAEEVHRHGIRVQTIMPDAVATPLWDQNGAAAVKPNQALPAERVAELIVHLLSLPRDTYLVNTVIAPFKARGRKKRG
jgi:3-oxoacyl-[acyl-carrier protein] reductase